LIIHTKGKEEIKKVIITIILARHQIKNLIKRFSGTGLTIYYDDNRTNNPCKCNHCSGPKIEKTINWDKVVIVETKAQRERDLKLKLILGKL
jgi:hypothetical protein